MHLRPKSHGYTSGFSLAEGVGGRAVARKITLTGSSAFHYDEALGKLAPSIYTVISWEEI